MICDINLPTATLKFLRRINSALNDYEYYYITTAGLLSPNSPDPTTGISFNNLRTIIGTSSSFFAVFPDVQAWTTNASNVNSATMSNSGVSSIYSSVYTSNQGNTFFENLRLALLQSQSTKRNPAVLSDYKIVIFTFIAFKEES